MFVIAAGALAAGAEVAAEALAAGGASWLQAPRSTKEQSANTGRFSMAGTIERVPFSVEGQSGDSLVFHAWQK